MGATFTAGATVYDRHGRAGRYVARVDSGYVIEQIYEDSETGDPYPGPVDTWREVFTTPPTEQLHVEVRELEQQAASIRQQLDAMREERRALDAEHKARAERIKRHEQLARLDDFIAGRITHFVVIGGSVKVQEAAKELASDESRYDKALRLLSLYGGTKGDLTWKLNRYSDGSGSSTEVIPCLSFDEAMAAARKRVAADMDALRPVVADRPWQMEGTLKSAAELGMEVPADLAALMSAYRLKTARDQLEKARTALADAQARVADLEGAPATVGDGAQEA
jgi:uncharacterized membrane protein